MNDTVVLVVRARKALDPVLPRGLLIRHDPADGPNVVTISDGRKFIEENDGTFSEVVAVADPVEEALMHSQQRHVMQSGFAHPDSPAAGVAPDSEKPALPALIGAIEAKLVALSDKIHGLRCVVDHLNGAAEHTEIAEGTAPQPMPTGVVPLLMMIRDHADELDQTLHHQLVRLRQIV